MHCGPSIKLDISYKHIIAINLLAVLIFSSGPFFSKLINDKYQTAGAVSDIWLPKLDDWSVKNVVHEKLLKPIVTKPDYTTEGQYLKDNTAIDVYIYAYNNNKNGKEIIHHDNTPYDRKIWVMARQGVRYVELRNGKTIRINEVQVSNGGKDRLIHYYYMINGSYLVSPYKVKLREITVKLLGMDMDSRMYVLSLDLNSDVATAREALINFESEFIESH